MFLYLFILTFFFLYISSHIFYKFLVHIFYQSKKPLFNLHIFKKFEFALNGSVNFIKYPPS